MNTPSGWLRFQRNNILRVQIAGKTCTLTLLLLIAGTVFSQSTDTTQGIRHFTGKVSVTNNGIAYIPIFSLGKPAVLFNLSLGGDRLVFEPDVRFALEGKPWVMIFWWRYQAIRSDKFSLRIGLQPAMNFRTIPAISNGKSKDVIESRRYIGAEIFPSYALGKNVRIGLYYLYSYGFDDSPKQNHFLVLTSRLPNIRLAGDLYFGINPSVYFLKLDQAEGYYFSPSLRLLMKGFPLSVEALFNQIMDSEILPDEKLVWNVSLVYSFNNKYLRQ